MIKDMYNVEKIKKKIDKYEYVSFDIFDTLIKRNVDKPSDIFNLTAKKYETENNIVIPDYKELRINAEIKAKQVSEGNEPNIDDIFNQIKVNDKCNIDRLKEIEIELEEMLCQKNKYFYPIYDYCIKQNKKIIITTDMYLNRKYIEEILGIVGISGYQYLFVSNEIKLNKYRGNIYPYILKKLNISAKQIIHIGDSKRADYIMPKLFKIDSVLIPKQIHNLRYYNLERLSEIEKDDYSIINTFINNNMPIYANIYYQIGYEILGILLYGYTKWLIKQISKQKIEKIFFLAREGNLLKKSFDKINHTKVKSHYLYVSRRSTRVSLLKDIEKVDDIFKIIKMRRIVDLKGFFINIGLNIEKYDSIIKKYNYDLTTNVKNEKNFTKFFEEIKHDIKENAEKEEKLLLKYLKQEDFYGKVAVVDIGWMGTMQNSLNNILKKDNQKVDITGFYMGQSTAAKEFIDKGNKQISYLFDYKSNKINKEIRGFLNLFESFFLAQHGTTIKYSEKSGKIVPVLGNYEYTKQEIEIFKAIQEGAMQFIDDYSNFRYKNYINITHNIAWNNFRKLGLQPTNQDIKLFADISYVETTKVKFAKPNSIVYYIFNPKKFYYDFCNCSWKVGFLKRLLKLKLNYEKIVLMIYK